MRKRWRKKNYKKIVWENKLWKKIHE